MISLTFSHTKFANVRTLKASLFHQLKWVGKNYLKVQLFACKQAFACQIIPIKSEACEEFCETFWQQSIFPIGVLSTSIFSTEDCVCE